MKKIILYIVFAGSLLTSCAKGDIPVNGIARQENSDLIKDWITLHIKLIKRTTGVTHVAYSRHFAYTGVALYESLVKDEPHYKSLAGLLNGSVQLPTPPSGKQLYWPAAANAAVADMLRFFYAAKTENLQSIDSLEQLYVLKYNKKAGKGFNLEASGQFGKHVAAAVIEWSKQDGAANANIPYTPLGEGFWEPTPNGYAAANVPGWGNNKTILKESIQIDPCPAPPAFSKVPGSPFYEMAKELYDVSLSLTGEQKAVANFWDDAPNGKYITAFGHWFNILKQVLENRNINLAKAAEAYMRLGITMNDATIYTWQKKYSYHQLRPITYIRNFMGHAGWESLISTPPHPEYLAAHATISASAAAALELVLGKNYSFTDHSYDELGMQPRSFPGFEAVGYEAGLSRLYGGIHFKPSIEAGNMQGKKIAGKIQAILKTQVNPTNNL